MTSTSKNLSFIFYCLRFDKFWLEMNIDILLKKKIREIKMDIYIFATLFQAFFVHNAKFFGPVQTKIRPTLHACTRKMVACKVVHKNFCNGVVMVLSKMRKKISPAQTPAISYKSFYELIFFLIDNIIIYSTTLWGY